MSLTTQQLASANFLARKGMPETEAKAQAVAMTDAEHRRLDLLGNRSSRPRPASVIGLPFTAPVSLDTRSSGSGSSQTHTSTDDILDIEEDYFSPGGILSPHDLIHAILLTISRARPGNSTQLYCRPFCHW